MKQSLLSLSLAAGLAVSAFAGETETNKPAVPPVTAENKAVTCTISPERNVLASDKPNTALVKVALKGGVVEAGKRPSVNMAIVIDRSGSMSGDRIVRAKEAAIAAIERLNENDYVSVVCFDDRIDVVVPAQPVKNAAAMAEKIRAIEARGSTAIFGGVSQGAQELRKNIERNLINRILLLSDGEANVGPSTPDELGLFGASLLKEKISVSTLGIGLGYNENLMTRLAGRSDGNSYFIESSDDLPRIFAAELGDVLSVAAKDVKIAVRFTNAVPVELIGRDGRIENGVVTLDFNQIYSKQEKYVLIRTEFPVGRDGEKRDFAVAEVSYTLPQTEGESGNLKTLVAAASGSVSFSASAKAVEESANAKVLLESTQLLNAINTEMALEYNAAGKYEEAQRLIQYNIQLAAENQRAAEAAGIDADLRKDFEEMTAEEQRAEKEVSESMDSFKKKSMRTRSFRRQNQQKSIEK